MVERGEARIVAIAVELSGVAAIIKLVIVIMEAKKHMRKLRDYTKLFLYSLHCEALRRAWRGHSRVGNHEVLAYWEWAYT